MFINDFFTTPEDDSKNQKSVTEYKDYFKKPVQEPNKPVEKRFHGHEEYAEFQKKQQEKDRKQKDVAEGSLNEFSMGDDGEDPVDNYPCYDCGSTIFLHHTKLCELAEPNEIGRAHV